MSIKTRLAISVALVLTVTLVSLGVVLARTTRATLVGQLDDRLMETSSRSGSKPWPQAASQAQQDAYDDGSERLVAEYVYAKDGRPLKVLPCGFADDPAPEPTLPAFPSDEANKLTGHIVTLAAVDASQDYRVYIRRGDAGEYVVTASSLTVVDDAISRLIRALVIAGTLALAAATLASWWLIRRGLRPVDRMVDTAAAIAEGDLGRRVPAADPHSELGRLGHALNDMLFQIERGVDERVANEERLRRFVADAAHELRTPLTSLRGYSELYRQGALAEQSALANAMGRIEAEGSRMARLVDDLLLLARLDRARSLELEPVDVARVVGDAAQDFQAVEPGRPLTQDIDGPAIVPGDDIRLRQIVDNLLANARTHTPVGTPVHLAVRRRGGFVEIIVADDGPGISAADQARVFERFWRADPSRTRRTGGTGLGLAIASSLAQAHGGSVELRSEPGHGATFTVRLPAAS